MGMAQLNRYKLFQRLSSILFKYMCIYQYIYKYFDLYSFKYRILNGKSKYSYCIVKGLILWQLHIRLW